MQFILTWLLSFFMHVVMCTEGCLHKTHAVCYCNCDHRIYYNKSNSFDNLNVSMIIFLIIITSTNPIIMCPLSMIFFCSAYLKYMINRKQCRYFNMKNATMLYIMSCISTYYTFYENHPTISFLLLITSSFVIPLIFS